MWSPDDGDDAYRRLPVLLRLCSLRGTAPAQARRLLRVLLLWHDPLSLDPGRAAGRQRSHGGGTRMKGTVLVVDDDQAILEMIQWTLEEEGYRVLTSVGGAALATAHQTQPDL